MMDEDLKTLGEAISAALPGVVLRSFVAYDELNLVADAEHILKVLTYLRDDPACLFICPIDITAVDYPTREQRFDVVYHLMSPRHNQRVRVVAPLDEDEPIASATDLFPFANWYEREVWDMYGVYFTGHPDLRRILTDYGFEGHPLRKDFPMTGYVEVRYDDEQKRVVYEPVRLNQEFRNFDFLSPWEGDGEYQLPGDEKASGGART